MDSDLVKELDPFDIFDAEAARLDRFFASLDEEGWNRPSRCAGWSVRDVLGHLAGEELYNHACLDDTLKGFDDMLASEGVTGYDEFNEWCVRERRGLPVAEVLTEWREGNGQTRERMRALGRETLLPTGAGPYPVGLQTFHYCSEYATHADDVGVPVTSEEAAGRLHWRVLVGRFALDEQDRDLHVEPVGDRLLVWNSEVEARIPPADFVEATVGRLPAGHALDPRLTSALRCLS